MSEQRYIDRQIVAVEIDRIARSRRFSEIKVLIELLASTAAVVFWGTSEASFFDVPRIRLFLVSAPILLNSVAWVFWIVVTYMSLVSSVVRVREWTGFPEDFLGQYDVMLSALRRQKRWELIYDLLTGLQFFTISLSMAARFMEQVVR